MYTRTQIDNAITIADGTINAVPLPTATHDSDDQSFPTHIISESTGADIHHNNYAIDFDNASPLPTDHGTELPQPLMRLHERLCHLALPRLVKFAAIIGCPLSDHQAKDCTVCLRGKMARSRANKHPTPEARSRLPFELIYFDPSGKIQPMSLHGHHYMVAFRDDHSSFVWLRYAKSKNEFAQILDRFLLLHPKVSRLRMDRDPVNTSFRFQSILAAHSVRPEYRDTHKPEQLGFVENIFRWIGRATTAVLIQANAPRDHWHWASRFVVGTTNIIPSVVKGNRSAHFMLFGHQPSAAGIRKFGSTAYTFQSNEDRTGKFDDHAVKTIYLGQDALSRGSIVYDFHTRHERVTNECKILEDQPFYNAPAVPAVVKDAIPQAGLDLSAMFMDVDYDTHDSPESHAMKLVVRGPNNPTWRTALRSSPPIQQKWINADTSEFNSLKDNNVLGPEIPVHALPNNATVIQVRLVLKIKTDGRYKVRYCADGRSLIPGLDFDTHGAYSPVARFQSLRMFLSIAARFKLTLKSMDAETAYQQASLPPGKPIYVRMPARGRDDINAGSIHILRKALYGLQVAGRAWYNKLANGLTSYGYRRLAADSCIFVKGNGASMVIICCYVDDLWIAYPSYEAFAATETAIRKDFKFGKLESLKHSLGVTITSSEDRGTVSINQQQYIETMIDRWGMSEANGQSVPIPTGSDLQPSTEEEHEAAKHLDYRELVGSLNYACLTVIEIQFAVNALSRFFHRWSKRVYTIALGVLRYLITRPHQCITYRSDVKQTNEITGWSDADYGGDRATRKSTGCFYLFMNGGYISGRVFTMKTIARSTADAESAALAACVSDVLFCREFLSELGIYRRTGCEYDTKGFDPYKDTQVEHPPTVIYCDNQATIKLAKRRTTTDQSKHLCVRQAFLHHASEETAKVTYRHVESTKNRADLGTKLLDRVTFERLRNAVYDDADVALMNHPATSKVEQNITNKNASNKPEH